MQGGREAKVDTRLRDFSLEPKWHTSAQIKAGRMNMKNMNSTCAHGRRQRTLEKYYSLAMDAAKTAYYLSAVLLNTTP